MYWIIWIIMGFLNTVFLGIIFIVKSILKGIIYINDSFVKIGNHCGKYVNQDKIEKLILKLGELKR